MMRQEFLDLMERRGLSQDVAERSWDQHHEALELVTVEEIDRAFAEACIAVAMAKRLEGGE